MYILKFKYLYSLNIYIYIYLYIFKLIINNDRYLRKINIIYYLEK